MMIQWWYFPPVHMTLKMSGHCLPENWYENKKSIPWKQSDHHKTANMIIHRLCRWDRGSPWTERKAEIRLSHIYPGFRFLLGISIRPRRKTAVCDWAIAQKCWFQASFQTFYKFLVNDFFDFPVQYRKTIHTRVFVKEGRVGKKFVHTSRKTPGSVREYGWYTVFKRVWKKMFWACL